MLSRLLLNSWLATALLLCHTPKGAPKSSKHKLASCSCAAELTAGMLKDLGRKITMGDGDGGGDGNGSGSGNNDNENCDDNTAFCSKMHTSTKHRLCVVHMLAPTVGTEKGDLRRCSAFIVCDKICNWMWLQLFVAIASIGCRCERQSTQP